jgi:tetratricopeptide (TPR) repeat protein
MAKGKHKLVKPSARGFGSVNLDEELRRVQKHVRNEDWVSTCDILLPLSQQFPQNKRVWKFLCEASFEAGDLILYQKACKGLLDVNPNDDGTTYALAGAYLKNQHPMLALHTFRQALELNPNYEFAAECRDIVSTLEPIVQDLLDDFGMSHEQGFQILMRHELGQAYLEQGDFALARETEVDVLNLHPGFSAAHNNLSLIAWLENDTDSAVATAQAVLETEPDNTHALSNLIKFQVLVGNADAARPYGERLKAASNKAWDGWTKKIEGLSYLADDAGVVEVFQQALVNDTSSSPQNALFYHWAAVAFARTGDTKCAIAQWKKAIKIAPNLGIAQQNLDDIQKSVGQRHGAWPFSWKEWLMPQSTLDMRKVLEQNLKSGKSGNLKLAFEALLLDHPDMMNILPTILERGGPDGQEFVLSTAEQLETPELLAVIKDFALSQNGSDPLRNRAAVLVVKHKLLPKESVRFWIDGEWREIMVLAYEFYDEPLNSHSAQVNALLEKALHLLRTGGQTQAKNAETLLIQALEREPDSPDLLNNLAVAYINQKREAEGFSLVREIASRFPDYVFAAASVAKLCMRDGDLETAETLLHPFISRDRFHFLEFRAFCDAYIELLVAQKKLDVARSWLNLWENADPDTSQLNFWKKRLGLGKFKLPNLWQ